MEAASKLLWIILLCSFYPGVTCYQYSMVGLVVSSVVACVMFVVVIIWLVTVGTMHSWYPKYQFQRGKVKVPRPKPVAKPKAPKEPYPLQEVKPNSVPVSQNNSRPTTFRQSMGNGHYIVPNVNNVDKTDLWIQEIPTPRENEKVAQMQFEEEDDDVIVTEIVTENTTKENSAPTELRASQRVQSQTVGQRTSDIEITLKKEPLIETSIDEPDGTMNFGFEGDEDEAVADFSASRKEGESMVLY